MKVDDMPAGREMDALIAEKVIRWEVFYGEYKGYELLDDEIAQGYPPEEEVDGVPFEIPNYSTDIAAAWEVVEQMRNTPCKDGDHYCFELFATNKWAAVFKHHLGEMVPEEGFKDFEYFMATAETAPLAICRAALKAMGVL